MKTVCTIFLLCGSLKLCAQFWLPQGNNTLPFGYFVTSISVPADTVIWITASSYSVAISPNPVPSSHFPLVRKSLDGGQTWESYTVEEAQGRLSFDIEAIDANRAWLTVNSYDSIRVHQLYETTDGGESWTPVLEHGAAGVYVEILDDAHLVCVNSDYVAWSSDLGTTWNTDTVILADGEYTELASGNNAVCSVGDTIWFGTTHGNIVRVTQYGESIEVIPTGMSASIASVAFSDHLHGMLFYYINVSTYGVLRTFDGGSTWEETPSEPESIHDFNLSYVPGTQAGFIAVSSIYQTGTVYYLTSDFGDTWTSEGNIPGNTTNAVVFRSPEVGWVTSGRISQASQPSVYKWNGEIISGTAHVQYTPAKVSVFPNPSSKEIRYVSDQLEAIPHTVTILDAHGRAFSYDQPKDQKIDISSLPSGLYFLQVCQRNLQGVTSFIKE